MTKFFKGKTKKEAQAKPVPRPMDVIKARYAELTNRAGDLGYQIYVLPKHLEAVNKELESLNYEAQARQQLDTEAAKATSTEQPVESSQQ